MPQSTTKNHPGTGAGVRDGRLSLSAREAFAETQVDQEAGIIRNVSVITAGPAIGHGFDVDTVMLQQVADRINAHKGGVRSRMTHPENGFFGGGTDGVEVLVGRAKNARVEGDRTRADIHFGKYASFSPRGDLRRYLLGIAEEDPEAIGLSIVFTPAEPERRENGAELARVQEMHAVDFVGDPAANPGGLLSERGASERSRGSEPAKQEGANAMDDLTPNEGESREDFIARFVADPGMQEKYPDEAARRARAEAIWAEQNPAEEGADAPEEPEATTTAAPEAPPMSAGDQVQKALTADRGRRAEIKALAATKGMSASWAEGLCDRGVSLADAKKLMEVAMENKPVPTDVTAGEDRSKIGLGEAIRDAVLIRANQKVEKPHERVKEFKGMPILEIGRRFLEINGVSTIGMGRSEIARLLLSRFELARRIGSVALTHSTSDFPLILQDAMGKSLRTAYDIAPSTWRIWARQTTAPDFKQIKRLQLGEAPALAAMAEGAEYTYGTLGEAREVYTLAKYGRAVRLTREMLINDDLDAFARIIPAMGRMARYLEDDVCYGVLTANAAMSDLNNLFSAAHLNVGEGEIGVPGVGAARAAMRLQTGIDGATLLNIAPAYLIVPVALETLSEQFLNTVTVLDTATGVGILAPNPFKGRLIPVAEPRLDATSDTQWYLAADPNRIDTVEVCFLEGEEAPVIEEDEDFNTDARSYKVRHQVAAKAVDWRGLFRSTGVDAVTTTAGS